MRILLTSDTHNCRFDWYGVSTEERLKLWADSICEEHRKNPIDLILMLGDYSLDFWCAGGSYTDRKISMTDSFVKNYVSLLPKDVPFYMIPGNHEQYTEEHWNDFTGRGRKAFVKSGDNMFILLDSFSENLEPGCSSDGTYVPLNLNYLQYLMCGFDCKNVFLCCHWFDLSLEKPETLAYIASQPRIKCIFQGHSHSAAVIDGGNTLGGKKIIQTGNFSYTHKGREDDMFWGYRMLEINEDKVFTEYIMPACKADKSYEAIVDGRPNPAPATCLKKYARKTSHTLEIDLK